jgi:ClpP class serine protease
MEEVAQGRVWTGKDAASHGLVDAIGGISRAIAIAKLKANIPQDRQVDLTTPFILILFVYLIIFLFFFYN